MRFEAMLGMWAFGFVCLAIIIVIISLKVRYEHQQKNQQKTDGKVS